MSGVILDSSILLPILKDILECLENIQYSNGDHNYRYLGNFREAIEKIEALEKEALKAS